MTKAMIPGMNYYERLVKKVSQSMNANPHKAMVMNSESFEIIAKSPNLKMLSRKLPDHNQGPTSVVFQRPNQKAVWILGQYSKPA